MKIDRKLLIRHILLREVGKFFTVVRGGLTLESVDYMMNKECRGGR